MSISDHVDVDSFIWQGRSQFGVRRPMCNRTLMLIKVYLGGADEPTQMRLEDI